MSSDLQLTLLELIRRLNGISTLESGGLPRGRGRPADSTSRSVSVPTEEEDSKGCTNSTCGAATEDHQEEPVHGLRPRPKDRKGAAVE
uniref:X protein n=1 Tax=Parrot bornavirus 5 TaxID=1884879 RepID=A0A410RDJ7_9MONO|nr:X protein [Parrot bornavirus 5]